MKDPASIYDIRLDVAAADAVMNYGGVGLRGYATAGGLNPASDFQELDLRGWDFSNQDVRGFNFAGSDLRGTNIFNAMYDETTCFDNAKLDAHLPLDSFYKSNDADKINVDLVVSWVQILQKQDKIELLAVFGKDVMPVVEELFKGASEINAISSYVAWGEIEYGLYKSGKMRLERVEKELYANENPNFDDCFRIKYIKSAALNNLGQNVDALKEIRAARRLLNKISGNKIIQMCNILSLEVAIFLNLGQINSALESLDALSKTYHRANDSSESIIDYQKSVILSLNQSGKVAEALVKIEELISKLKKANTVDSRSFVIILGLKALILKNLSRSQEVLDQIKFIMLFGREKLGADSPQLVFYNLIGADALYEVGKYDDALLEVDNISSFYEKNAMNDYPAFIETCRLRAAVLSELGRGREATEEIEKTLFQSLRLFGEKHPITLNTQFQYASILSNMGKVDLALAQMQGIIPIWARLIGINHWQLLVSRSLRNGLLISAGRLSDVSLEELQQIALRLERHGGNGWKYTMWAWYRLARYYFLTNNASEARSILNKILSAPCNNLIFGRYLESNSRKMLDIMDGRIKNANFPA